VDQELLKVVQEKYERYQRYRAAVAVAERELNDAVDRLVASGADEDDVRRAITGYGDVRPRLRRVPRKRAEKPEPEAPPPGRRPPPPRFKAGEEGWWDDSK
jgi:hypothetical protein